MIGAVGFASSGTALIGLDRGARPLPAAPKPATDGLTAANRPAGTRGGGVLASFDTVRALLDVASAEEDAQGLTEQERKDVAKLKDRDREVRRHEQAHASAGGQYAGAPSYTFERGPDGRTYAVAGTTPIDVSPIPGDPQATIRKMQTVKRAALAPADPSPQDRRIAAQAESQRLKAQSEAARADEDETRPGATPGALRPAMSLHDLVAVRQADVPTRSGRTAAFGRTPTVSGAPAGAAQGTGRSGDNLVSLLA